MSDQTKRSMASTRSTRVSTRIGKESTQKTLRMQQQQIDSLKKENDELRQKYEFESRIPPSTKPKAVQFQELHNLSQQGKTLDEKKAALIEENKQLQTEINQLSKAVNEKRVELRGVYSTKDNDTALALQIRTLENRLDQALLRYSQAVTENKKLRETIDSMRCERVIFDGVHKKMEKALFEKKQEMAAIIEEANVSYEEREACDQEKSNIADQQNENRHYFEQESQTLDQEIKKCDQLSEFFRSGASDGNEEEEDGIPTDGVQVGAQEHAINQLSQEKLQAYEEALWRIKNATGIDTVDALVTRYLDVEDKIVTNNNIIGDLEVQIQRLEKEEREDRERAKRLQESAQQATDDHAKETAELEKQTQATKERTQSYTKKREDTYQSISALYPLVSDLFEKAQCEQPDDANAEGTITQTNIVSYLGQIEQKANDLRAIYLQLYPQALTLAQQSIARGDGADASPSAAQQETQPADAGDPDAAQPGDEEVHERQYGEPPADGDADAPAAEQTEHDGEPEGENGGENGGENEGEQAKQDGEPPEDQTQQQEAGEQEEAPAEGDQPADQDGGDNDDGAQHDDQQDEKQPEEN